MISIQIESSSILILDITSLISTPHHLSLRMVLVSRLGVTYLFISSLILTLVFWITFVCWIHADTLTIKLNDSWSNWPSKFRFRIKSRGLDNSFRFLRSIIEKNSLLHWLVVLVGLTMGKSSIILSLTLVWLSGTKQLVFKVFLGETLLRTWMHWTYLVVIIKLHVSFVLKLSRRALIIVVLTSIRWSLVHWWISFLISIILIISVT